MGKFADAKKEVDVMNVGQQVTRTQPQEGKQSIQSFLNLRVNTRA